MTQVTPVVDPNDPPYKTLPSLLGVTGALPGAVDLQAVRERLRAAIDAHELLAQQEYEDHRSRLLDEFRSMFASDVPFELRAVLDVACTHWGDEDGGVRVVNANDDEPHRADDPLAIVRWPVVGSSSAALQVTTYPGWADGQSPPYEGRRTLVWRLQAADAAVAANQHTPYKKGWGHLHPVDEWATHEELAGALLFHLCRMLDARDAYYAKLKAANEERERTVLNVFPQTPTE